ncbi:PepSY domain-containing protein [Actinoplanes philippinensis]|uniref:PepSY domain-containing protein n=1 Tax=Actinoplanes philippinensis TaxID=35752 RepID=UPI0033E3B89F
MKLKKNVAAVMMTAGVLAALGFGGVAFASGGSDDIRPPASASPSPTADDSLDPSPSPSSSSPDDSSSSSAGGTAVTASQAELIAIRAAGGGRVESVEREIEHGRLVWDVDVIVDGVEHDIDVDAATGEVTRHRTDGSRGRSGGDDRSGGSDDRGRGRDDRGSDDRGSDDSGSHHGRGSDDKGGDDKGGRGRGGDD